MGGKDEGRGWVRGDEGDRNGMGLQRERKWERERERAMKEE